MKQLTRQDLKDVLKEVGVVTKDNLGNLLNQSGVVTKKDFGGLLNKSGVVTKKDLSVGLSSLEKKIDRKINGAKKELITMISGVAVNSPTSDQFYKLEKRVSDLEPIVN